MYGRDDDHDRDEEDTKYEYQPPVEHSLDLLATKEIFALPPPRHDVPLMDPRPVKLVQRPNMNMNVTRMDSDALLKEYKNHWKNVRKE